MIQHRRHIWALEQMLPQNRSRTIPVTLLVVDDEPLVREFVTDALSMYGYEVLPAKHGEEALSVLEADTASKIALVLTDMTMPIMNGVELAEKIREIPDGPGVLFMTGYLDDQGAINSLVSKQESLLEKPFTPQQLI
ncbi:MAG: response regulator, partial [SAR202 cluster bacterium]|nr:response regulator [SAR202 cluster bacterium]